MFVHTTIIKVKPENVQKVTEYLNSPEQNAYFAQIDDILHGFVLESNEEPGMLISLSFWKSQAGAQAVFADPRYAALVAGLREYLIAAPQRLSYNMLSDLPFNKSVIRA